jgi:hypothetical protein
MQLSGTTQKKVEIELQGVIGTFEIPGGSARVKFFSTFASNRDTSAMEFKLLEELKPMRENTEVKELENLDVLFQRDLNDSRIANGLIPYLSGTISKLAFFPAILGVLMPDGFINKKGIKYPSVTSSDGNIINFDDHWKIEHYNLKQETTPLGLLKIDPKKTKVLVIDGQHRANAFRWITDTFLNKHTGSTDNDVYRAFYENVQKPQDFQCDLPITLIWFEKTGKHEINPTEISRKLFVDVNNTARKVNISRNILLDDFDVASLLTRFFLSKVVSVSKFAADKFSLLHAGFDIDSDAANATDNKFVLTSPQKIKEMMSWFFLGANNSSLPEHYRAQRSVFINITEFQYRIKNVRIARALGEKRMRLVDADDRATMETEFGNSYLPAFWKIFSDFILYNYHYQVCKNVEDMVRQDSVLNLTWDKIIAGGEGLFYTYKEEEITNKGKHTTEFVKYSQAIAKIENYFDDQKKKAFKFKDSSLYDEKNKKVSDSIKSIAFQVGLIMAFREYEEKITQISGQKVSPESIATEYIENLNKFNAEAWFYILTDLKQELSDFLEIQPKLWPVYQKIFAKVLEESDGRFSDYFDYEDNQKNIESRIFELTIKRKIKNMIAGGSLKIKGNSYHIPDADRDLIVTETVNNHKDLFKRCKFKYTKIHDLQKFSKNIFTAALKSSLSNNLNSTEEGLNDLDD